VVTAIAWAIAGQPSEGVVRVVTVLVIACPHALGLAIPLVTSISTATAARNGILVKDRLALERMRDVDAVLFDKTGTLTLGNHAVTDLVAVNNHDPADMLRKAAAVETESEHPIARAIVAAASGPLPSADHITSLTGIGVQGTIDEATVAVGGPALLDHLGIDEPTSLEPATDRWRQAGSSVLYVTENRAVIGALTLADQIRPESPRVISELHQRGVHVALITGDAAQVADHVAEQLGIDEVFADVLPADKDAKVTELQARGLTVAMVGDGVNDAPALARADVGLAIGAGTDVAIESAGVILASSSPAGVTNAIDLSTATYRKMIQNLIWASGYNLAAIPIAAGALAFAGINIPPAAAAIAMSLSTIIVAANAQTLRRLRLN
jgi:Cu2+-exporting ATPase